MLVSTKCPALTTIVTAGFEENTSHSNFSEGHWAIYKANRQGINLKKMVNIPRMEDSFSLFPKFPSYSKWCNILKDYMYSDLLFKTNTYGHRSN